MIREIVLNTKKDGKPDNLRYLFRTIMLLFAVMISVPACKTVIPEKENKPVAKKGVLNLQTWNFHKDGYIPLDGEWAFYWKEWMPANSQITGDSTHFSGFIKVPNYWNDYQSEYIDKPLPGTGYATYRLKVILGKDYDELAFKMLTISTAYQLFVNGKQIGSAGAPAKQIDNAEPAYSPQVVDFRPDSEILDIVLHVSNYHHRRGGPWESILLGEENQLQNARLIKIAVDFFLGGSILIMALYHFGLFFLRRRELTTLYFGIGCLLVALRIATVGEIVIKLITDIGWENMVRIEYISFYLSVPAFFMFFYTMFKKEFSSIVFHIALLFSLGYSVFVLFSEPLLFSHSVTSYQLFALVIAIYGTYGLVRALIKKREGAIPIFVGFMILLFTFINDILYQETIIKTTNLSAFGLFVFIFFQAYSLSVRFTAAFKKNEELSHELNYHNENLERLVAQRTHEIERQNTILTEQKQAITDSILYAERIQSAILPNEKSLASEFNEHFIFYKPRDIVSGDFYWYKKIGYNGSSKHCIAVADCTGHGVPGALISMLGISFLNEITGADIEPNANLILEDLRQKVKSSLNQDIKHIERQEGMDIAFCVIDKRKMKLQFAGAYNPLFIVRNNELIEIKATRNPIGAYLKEIPFACSEFELQKDDKIYMFSDGYIDQFRDNKGRKFLKRNFRELILNISSNSLSLQKQILADTFTMWKGNSPQIDDLLVLAVKI